ncbi:MAG: filamentous hemagglutinin N-terminal domain-containing protein [Rhizonema sp. PD38]|nr:filamentous hemagglutinin N-terminal domain-containing protein [Rhizonema sp. PD38]
MSFGSMRLYWLQSLGIAIGSAIALYTNSSIAQITPDRTLPNSSNVRLEGNTRILSGGTTRGANLFHSFSEFSVPSGSTALFNNALDIQNIISRVTGKSISDINGLITSNGTANLFLINPNGIIFGKDASLNIGGSFVATTANAIGFGNFGFFSASNPEAPTPMLTVNPNALLFNQIAVAPIQNNSTAPAGVDPAGFNAIGLRVPDGHSLLLIGGNVNIDGGQLNAYGGRVELGGLAARGNVGLNVDGNNLSLGFPASSQRADISLSNSAAVYVEANGGGSIAVNARNLEVSGGSVLSAGIGRGLGSVGSQAGDITLNPTGEIKFIGSGVVNDVRQLAIGNGGNINISSGSFSLTNGAQLLARTFGNGNGGNINVDVGGAVTIAGVDNNRFPSAIITDLEPGAIGKGGNIIISSGSFSLTNGSQLSASTYGQGNGGSVKINATGSATIDNSGVNSNVFGVGNSGGISIDTGSLTVANFSVLNTSTSDGARGRAGNITIIARDLVLFNNGFAFSRLEKGGIGRAGDIYITTDGSVLVTGIPSNIADEDMGQLVSATFGVGDAGNIIITAGKNVSFDGRGSDIFTLVAFDKGVGNAGNIIINSKSLSVLNGARLTSNTENQRNAGNINITAHDTIKVDGMSNGTPSQIATDVNPGARGHGGLINLNTEALSITNGAVVDADSGGIGAAGNVEVKAGSIRLDNKANIGADTTAGQGNINLNARDFLLLRRGSTITTSATGTATGGNITINTNNLVAIPEENSDIRANSLENFGGRISINAAGIFGIQFRQQDTPFSDITASSALGPQFSGTVTISTPEVDPVRGLVQLPTSPVNITRLVASNCAAFDTEGSSFTVTGRGGLPISPTEPLQDSGTLSAWVRLKTQPENSTYTTTQPQPTAISNTTKVAKAATPIVAATGWVMDRNGNVQLVAQLPRVNPNIPWQTPATCPVSQ